MFQLDKTVFKKQSFRQSDNTRSYWLSKSIDERFQASLYLQSVVYGFDINNPPSMDKMVFKKRKHKHWNFIATWAHVQRSDSYFLALKYTLPKGFLISIS